jgi:hypothetical protein
MAARSVQAPVLVAQTPLPGLASTASLVLSTTKSAASAGAVRKNVVNSSRNKVTPANRNLRFVRLNFSASIVAPS